ncbi:hypothetical protein [uncultured Fibrella sp.]|uniref:hypothetical protein n=1 Tax=uncultured Fibrella sp. TaxID=1284596 RepID=UPI0035CB13FB
MKAGLCVCLCVGFGLIHGLASAQQPHSARSQSIDSVAVQQFLAATGPAEEVFSFFSLPLLRFNSGVYMVSNRMFPLRSSPDSLVQLPIERAHRQGRRARISAIATAVPLAVFTYSVTRLVFSLGNVVAGRQSSYGGPNGEVIRVSGIGVVTGITVTGVFNIASLINLHKGVKRHNSRFGRKVPSLFNPKGL